MTKHWQDSTIAVLGAWLIASPLAMGFQSDFTALVNTEIVGVLLLAAALAAIFVPRGWQKWAETALGLWLVVSPWVLGFDATWARAHSVVTGLMVFTLALWALQDYEAGMAE